MHASASAKHGLPVIVVGNVIAGGAGKTPVTQAVVAHLQAAGWTPGILSRGYGRKTGDCREALPDSPASEVGDEPASGPQHGCARLRGGQAAGCGPRAARKYPQVDILVSDDGLQHLTMARDVELCVFNDEGVGNGFCCPQALCANPGPAM